MSEANPSAVNLEIRVESPHDDPTDDVWQQECRELYNRLLDLPEVGGVTPKTQPSQTGDKDVLEQFHELIAYGISIGAFSALYQVVKLWLEHRPRCDVTVTFPDGSEIKAKNVSLQEAERLSQSHQRQRGQA